MNAETIYALRNRLANFEWDVDNVVLANEYGAITWVPLEVALESPSDSRTHILEAAMEWYVRFEAEWERLIPSIPSFESRVIPRTLRAAGSWRYFASEQIFRTIYHGNDKWYEYSSMAFEGIPTGEQLMLTPLAKPISLALTPKEPSYTDFNSRIMGLRASSEKEYPDTVLIAWPTLELGAILHDPDATRVSRSVITRISVTGRINVTVFCRTRLHEPSLLSLQAQNALSQHTYPLMQAFSTLGKTLRGKSLESGKVEVPTPQALAFGQFRL